MNRRRGKGYVDVIPLKDIAFIAIKRRDRTHIRPAAQIKWKNRSVAGDATTPAKQTPARAITLLPGSNKNAHFMYSRSSSRLPLRALSLGLIMAYGNLLNATERDPFKRN